MVNRSQTEEEARGVIHAFDQMRRIGHKLVNVSLHYKGNQGLDLIFQSQDGHLGTYAVMEAKHGKGPDSLAVDENGFVQGSPEYNKDRLGRYLDYGDKTQMAMAKKLLALQYSGKLKSYAAFYGSKSLYELLPVEDDSKKIKTVLIP